MCAHDRLEKMMACGKGSSTRPSDSPSLFFGAPSPSFHTNLTFSSSPLHSTPVQICSKLLKRCAFARC